MKKPFKFFVGFQSREKCLLHGVLGGGIVTQSKNGVFKKVVAMIVQPSAGIGGRGSGIRLGRAHTGSHSRLVQVRLGSKSKRGLSRSEGGGIEQQRVS